MKTPWELLKESKTKIKTTWRIAFVSALVLGLLIHLPVMLSDIPNHDGLSSMYFDQNMITSGRWFLTVACVITEDWAERFWEERIRREDWDIPRILCLRQDW